MTVCRNSKSSFEITPKMPKVKYKYGRGTKAESIKVARHVKGLSALVILSDRKILFKKKMLFFSLSPPTVIKGKSHRRF